MKRNGKARIGLASYEIKQEGIEEGGLIINLSFLNPNGDCNEYARFLDDFNDFLKLRQEATN
ncbi:hypothetical protein D3C74_257040 [compost metagenome]